MTEQKAVPVALLCEYRSNAVSVHLATGQDAHSTQPIYTQAALDAAVAAERAWRDAVDDMLTVAHMVASDDPRESINRLINWHVAVALDPAVSSDAAALVAAERERMIADGWRKTRYEAPVTECEACLTPDACAIRGQCGHYLRERDSIKQAPAQEGERP